MLGQLHDAGNTTTLAHYIRLLEAAYLVSGLERFSAGKARSRGSSPKLAVWNNALVTAIGSHPFAAARADGGVWGRLVENGVAAHLLNGLCGSDVEITWWREGAAEVDFVLAHGARVLAIEVKSGRGRGAGARQGLDVFLHRHRGARGLIVGTGGLPLEELFATDPRELLDA
jgi:predicted AAA+ superfamily ATPase